MKKLRNESGMAILVGMLTVVIGGLFLSPLAKPAAEVGKKVVEHVEGNLGNF